MSEDTEAVLILGWPLQRENLKRLMALVNPGLDPSDEERYQLWLADCQCHEMNGWHLVLTGDADEETYYLSALPGDHSVNFETLMFQAPQVLARGRLIATNIGISEHRPMRMHALLNVY